MPRQHWPSDDEHNDKRRKVPPHVKIHHSVKNHPKAGPVWADVESRGMLVELWRLASERGAAHTEGWLTVTPGDIVSITGRTQYAHATRALRVLVERMKYVTRERGACVEILIAKFAKKQGLTPRVERINGADSGRLPSPLSPLPTTHTPTAGEPASRASDPFEEAMALFPRRDGDNPKSRARRAWNARLRGDNSTKPATPEEMTLGVKRYAAWVRSRGLEGTRHVKQAATFFGPDCGFREPWALEQEQPKGNGALGKYTPC